MKDGLSLKGFSICRDNWGEIIQQEMSEILHNNKTVQGSAPWACLFCL